MPAKLAVFEVVVADMATAVAFYQRLGLSFPDDAGAQPHVEADLPGGLKLAFDTEDTIRSFDPGWVRATGGHGMALAFVCDDPAEVDATYRELVAAGGTGRLEPWDAAWGMRYASLEDPDGNPLDLFALL